ncbi:glycosyltransferase [Candidatus Pseudomonas adelgestsugas]|uniref:Glycosyltransferase EpsE n=1 Tax=Candidatus Pseudomonas adelgestsugas TaxID=1302376 RepID=A0ABX5R9D6_9PSED|nr:glycosyltransferase [Candidatus Pseudomonas adelgestsugas]QAX82159.1 Putative glycosyltransferase EpsE [Candidatus Pseudomonas adelgestsugas]
MSVEKSNILRNTDSIPLVSVVVPSYNYAKYISKAINSVINQSFSNFELLISDDCSLDNSWEVICNFNDPRIRTFQQEKNLGPVGNLIFLIQQARGKYIALLNSDDTWYPLKLSKQVMILTAQPKLGACFTWAKLVNETGKGISGPEVIWNDVFRQPNRTQAEWLKYFFLKGNSICHPSMLVRKEVFDKLGYYNPGLRQLPDFDMWIRLVKQFPIYIIQENLVTHMRSGNNISAVSLENSARNLTELVEIFSLFFESLADEVFTDGFSEYFKLKGVPVTQARLEAEKFFLLLESAFVQASGKAAALSWFIKRCTNPEFERVLRDEYMFSIFDFYQITGQAGFGHFFMAANQAPIPISTSVDEININTLKQGRIIYFLKCIVRHLRQER